MKFCQEHFYLSHIHKISNCINRTYTIDVKMCYLIQQTITMVIDLYRIECLDIILISSNCWKNLMKNKSFISDKYHRCFK